MRNNITIPKVSVIMGIYNCANTLPKAIDSILAQTFTDWELIMCDDGSTDNTCEIAERYADQYSNIIVLKNDKNMKLIYTLNRCLNHARGMYIARHDGDDESLPERFQKQVEFLDQHPEYAIVSCARYHFDINGIWGLTKGIEYPEKHHFSKGTPLGHASAIVRREAFEAVDGYTDEKRFLRVEDYWLWAKMYALGYKGCNLQEPLYLVLDDRNSISRRNFKARWNEFYVKNLIIGMLKLPFYSRTLTLKPLILWCLPIGLYKRLHKKRLALSSHPEQTNMK